MDSARAIHCFGFVLTTIRHHSIKVTVMIFLLITAACSYPKMFNLVDWITFSCSLSRIESDNFFCEPNDLWIERKKIYAYQDEVNMMKVPDKVFFKSNWESNFYCSYKMRVGRMGEGGKWVCDPFKLQVKSDCLVYSAGSSGDFSFEIELKKLLPKCSIFTFDKEKYSCPTGVCTFRQVVLGDGSGISKNWMAIAQELKHTNQVVDIFKIDIEGNEYEFFKDMFNSSTFSKNFPRQILVEVHPAATPEMHRFFELFRKNHYVIFNREPNLIVGPGLFEYAFLRLNTAFFRTSKRQ